MIDAVARLSFVALVLGVLLLTPKSSSSSLLPRLESRQSSNSEYNCDEANPCSNGACCGKSGFCGYGPTYCGTTGTSPNDNCWSNCDAHAPCGQFAETAGATCPLNVCCSQYGFCGTTSDFCATGCQSNCQQPGSGASGSNVQNRIIGYYESWSISKQCMGMNVQQIPVESLTHLNYAFAYVSPGSYEIGPMPDTDVSSFSDFTALKSRNPSVIIGISIGGWTFNDNGTSTQPVFGDLVSSSANRKMFIGNLMSFMIHYGFDAVDLDWEYPGAPDRQPSQENSKEDGANYVLLLQEMRQAFDSQPRDWKISFTAPTSYWYLRWFDIEAMSKVADYVNFMTYDLHGIWDANDPIGNQVLAHTNLTEIEKALDLLWRNSVEPAKVNLGLAFYSRTFELEDASCTSPGCPFKGGGMAGACTKNSGTLSYSEITDVLAQQSITPTYDNVAAVKYFTWNTDQWASYDDEETFQQKIKYANNQGLGGLLIWSVDQDDANLDALRGVLYPAELKSNNNLGDDVSYWQNQQPGACETTTCGGSCLPGTIEITMLACPSGGKKPQKLCCPISSAPDPSTCTWRGDPWLCNGQCHGGEVALASSPDGGNGHCHDGRQFYCCPVPEAIDGGINCGWKDTCSSDQTLMTFAGTFLEDIDPAIALAGLAGQALADALDKIDISKEKQYCCETEEASNWKDCYWAGTTGKGFSSCDDNHCATGIEVELTTSYFGEGETCAPQLKRQRAFCCTPSSGQSLFLPVPLEDLFPNPPPLEDADPIFNLEVDDTWGTGKQKPDSSEDPDHASFGFVVITSPQEVQVSLDKRDGSPWELLDCVSTDSERGQRVRMVCTDEQQSGSSLTSSACNDIHRGYGAPGTIIEMPAGCGAGRYAVAKEMSKSVNQTLPDHLVRRHWGSHQPVVYDLAFDYDFSRVPRDFGESLMRIDFSNEEGYWDAVVDRPGSKSRKTKRDLDEFRRNRKRWLEDEWRDAYHGGIMSRGELHRRWFGADVLAWLANMVGLGEASITNELHHSVDEVLNIILIDEQFSCPVGPALASASVKANLHGRVTVDTTFGLTIIATLSFPPDLSQSYLYFKNEGEVTATFTLDAVASISYSSGDIKLIGLDNFPGATFRVPGIVTIGPNLAVYASVDAALTVAGHLQADVTIAKWEIEQVYPQTAQYPVNALDSPDYDGSQTVGQPTFEASVSASGEAVLHLKPKVTFGIVFDSRWKVDSCSVDLVLDGYIVFHAELSASTTSDNVCPFTYGIDGGSNIYAQLTAPSLFGWGGTSRIPIASVPRKQLTPDTCEASAASTRLLRRDSLNEYLNSSTSSYSLLSSSAGDSHMGALSLDGGDMSLERRTDVFNLGPLITIPTGYLSCPSSSEDATDGCPICTSVGTGTLAKRQSDGDGGDVEGMSCPWMPPPSDEACSVSSVTKRGVTRKDITLSWSGAQPYSNYPACSASDLSSVSSVPKWFMPIKTTPSSCSPQVVKYKKDSGANTVKDIPISEFNTDHVFEVHLIADFLEWLCDTSSQIKYLGGGVIDFPNGWGRPDATWCKDVVGPIDGFQYAYKGSTENFIEHTAAFLGGTVEPTLLALYLKSCNGMKKAWISAEKVELGKRSVDEILTQVTNSASVFQYLQNSVQSAWTRPSNSIEAVADAFDQAFWTSGATPGGTPLTRPTMPDGVTHWGLRTLWCYWIDNHAAKIDEHVAAWLPNAKQALEQHTRGSRNAARNFIQNHMTGVKGLATINQMHLPRDPSFKKIPLPGEPGSGSTTKSKYLMWGTNDFGKLGL